MQPERPTYNKVLVVDLDQSLLKTDLLFEGLLHLIKHDPLRLPELIRVMLWPPRTDGGDGAGPTSYKVRLKQFLTEHVPLKPESLPYCDSVLQRVKTERAHGSHVVLASASHQKWVSAIASHLGLFDEAFGSSAEVNLKGKDKLALLRAKFPLERTTYIGDAAADLPIWIEVGKAVVVNPSRGLSLRLRSAGLAAEELGAGAPLHKTLAKAMRVHQWAKNLLLFVPLVMAHRVLDTQALASAGLAFVAFSALASSVYVLNDLLDLEADRAHPKKRHRPFAAGTLSIQAGLCLIPVLLGVAVVVTAWLPGAFAVTLAGYFGLNLLYSFRLKSLPTVDVVLLAAMYTFRVFAGGAATQIAVSDWLMAFCTFFFFGLAVLKRYTEVNRMVARRSVSGRGYLSDDKQALLVLGISGSMLSTVVLALYLNSPQVAALYRHPQHLWLVMPVLLFWIMRLWLQANRNEVDSDPVEHALKDPVSYMTAAALLGILLFAQ